MFPAPYDSARNLPGIHVLPRRAAREEDSFSAVCSPLAVALLQQRLRQSMFQELLIGVENGVSTRPSRPCRK